MAISIAQRRRISLRASQRCEYCLLGEERAIKGHEPDHIVPLKHGGTDEESNLAWACFQCNRYKGSDVAAYDHLTGELFALFNPRRQAWEEHFTINEGEIVALSGVGRVTVDVLQLNRPGRVAVRKLLMQAGLYP
jgi:hypothetical protein